MSEADFEELFEYLVNTQKLDRAIAEKILKKIMKMLFELDNSDDD